MYIYTVLDCVCVNKPKNDIVLKHSGLKNCSYSVIFGRKSPLPLP